MGQRAYLDHNATTPLRPVAAEAMARAFALPGNPSSIHAEGRAARAVVEAARSQVARAFGAEAKHVVFTSGATEGLNTLLRPSPSVNWRSGAKRSERLLVLASEHDAVMAGGGFAAEVIERIPVDDNGIVDLAWLETRLAALAIDGFAPVTVAIQLANGETGVIQPVAEASRIVRGHGAMLVCDAAQAAGKVAVDIAALGADALVVSAHKFGGPKGAGAIILAGERLSIGEPLLKGGGQEMRRRSGTENVAAIAGMGAAIAEATAGPGAEGRRLASLGERMIAGFRMARPDLTLFGEGAPRLPNTGCIGVPGLSSETAVIAFDLAGVAVSAGSACSSGKVKRSHVLEAMGVDALLAASALRFSLGWSTAEADIDLAVAAFAGVAGNARGQKAA
jgi:cysteine desulfurase